MQERDEHASVDPNKWSMIGGGVEAPESPADAARRELAEEAGIVCDTLVTLGRHDLPCDVHGHDIVDLFVGRTSVGDAEVVCGEGRQVVFLEPDVIAGLDLTSMSRQLLPLVISRLGGH